jgi:hypothetical protein
MTRSQLEQHLITNPGARFRLAGRGGPGGNVLGATVGGGGAGGDWMSMQQAAPQRGFLGNLVSNMTKPFRSLAQGVWDIGGFLADPSRPIEEVKPLPGIGLTEQERTTAYQDPILHGLKTGAGIGAFAVPGGGAFGGGLKGALASGAISGGLGGFGAAGGAEWGEALKGAGIGAGVGAATGAALYGAGELLKKVTGKGPKKVSESQTARGEY